MPTLLKSLELQGYKTFATRTLFEFAGSVTAIVGPNGSGKSNIADSLRWVLGEQSYSLLRGKKTEDMIFSGSEQRPRSGMASATIVFDNLDGWLPIDFSEVAITRRAYRDGENEYLLNGQRVRLRDVSELLSQSGLAERTYTIIGQGLVDAALSLKAEERRRLFEEAAGIGLHRSRREEALRRLEATRRNLDRVQDILVELHPRLRSLERQARRSQEYEQVKADLQVLLREWYGFHWRRTQQELMEAIENGRSQETLLDEARQSQVAKEHLLTDCREKIRILRDKLGEWRGRFALLHNERETIIRELAVGEERLHSIYEQCKNSQAELSRLEEEIGINQEKLLKIKDEAARLESELEEAKGQVQLSVEALSARQAEREQLEKRVQTARQNVGSLTGREAHLRSRLIDRQAQTVKQEEELNKLRTHLNQNEEELNSAQNTLVNLHVDLDKSQQKRQFLEDSHKSLLTETGQLESKRRRLLEQKSDASATVAKHTAHLEVLEGAEKNLAGYAAGARILIEAARKSSLKGARGALGSYIQVPAELEAAVAAVLGDFIDAILLEGELSSEEALDLLANKDARAALLPLNALVKDLPSPNLQPLTESQGVIGLAVDLVRAPEHLESALWLLLGQVIIVKDRSAARLVLKGQPGGVRAVTLKGEVFYSSGLILAGNEPKQTVLSRPREIRELRSKLDDLNDRVSKLDIEIRQLDESLAGMKRRSENLEKEIQQARQKEEHVRRESGKADLSLEKARRQVIWNKEQISRLDEERQAHQAEAARLSADLEPLESQILLSRQTLREEIAALNALSLDEFQTELAHWKTRMAVTERSLQAEKEQLRERLSALERASRVREDLLIRLGELESASQKIEAGKQALRQQESTVGESLKELAIKIEPAEADLKEIEQEQTEYQLQESVTRQALSAAEHHHAQAKIHLVRCQEALDSIRRRIEDDFGLVEFEYAKEISGPTPLPLDGMVEQLPDVIELAPEIEDTIRRQRGQLRRMGAINPEAQAEYQEVHARVQFMNEQISDLNQAEADVKAVILELDILMEREFRKTFDSVATEFRSIFTRLFGGGSARLILTDPEDLTGSGIDIEARLPGRRSQGLSLLSGGERSLTAAALVFSLLKVSPTPFCVLDEVDAMLDEANVGRFRELLRELSQDTQFIIVTHNRNTVQAADVIYGVTMGKDSASQVIGLKLDEAVSAVG
jgi:chromosome segregation protein